MPTESNLRPTKELLDALVTALTDLLWTTDNGAVKAFDRVELFDLMDLEEAFQQLIMNQNRVALIIYDRERFDEERTGAQMIIRRTHELSIVFTDRVIGNRQQALLGGPDNPGLLVLKDLVLPAVTGAILTNPKGQAGSPISGEPMLITKDKKMPGRLAYLLEVEAQGGWLKADLGRSPIF